MTQYNIRLNDGTTETIRADRYIGEDSCFKFFRGGHLPVFTIAVSDVKRVDEDMDCCATCTHWGDEGSGWEDKRSCPMICQTSNKFTDDMGCGDGSSLITSPDFYCRLHGAIKDKAVIE